MSGQWTFTPTAPTGQKLAPGTKHATADNDGTTIRFAWDQGDCGTTPEVGVFQIFDMPP